MNAFNTVHGNDTDGFSLLEAMIALILATYGLLAAGQLLYMSASAASLARSKETAALAAMDALESLSDLYHRNRYDISLAPGNHGPEVFRVMDPDGKSVLNSFRITWSVENTEDPRPGKRLDARLVIVTVTPIGPGNAFNYRPPFNKILDVPTIFSPRIQ